MKRWYQILSVCCLTPSFTCMTINSTDDTEKLAKKAGAVVRHEYQQGKGNVVRRMFQEIDAHCYILVDGDDTYPAESAAKMVKLVQEHNADM